MAGHGGHREKKNSKRNTDQAVLTITKSLTKTTKCTIKGKNEVAQPKKISGVLRRTGAPPLSNSFRRQWTLTDKRTGYRPMIASWSPMLAQDNCVLLTRGRWLSTEHPAVTGTGLLQLLPQEFRTVCRRTYKKPNCHTPGRGDRWRHYYLYSATMAHCELFLTAPCRNILIYLLTYLQTD